MINGNPIVQMRNVSKRFGKIQALDKLDLDIKPGEIIGLLGANGAGKSTLLRCVIGLYLADEGECVTFETDAGELGPKELGRIGYVHQEGELLEWMTVKQLIRYVSAYYENWNRQLEAEYIADFDISLKDRVGSLSPGQRQKLAILLAIGFEPELLILDEPASGLDPIARSQFLDMLLGIIQDENRTIIISSHILSDVEKVIDHTLIMCKGRMLRDSSFDNLREEFLRVTLTSLNGSLPRDLGFGKIIDCERENCQAVFTVQNYSQEMLEAGAKSLNCEIAIRPLSLEEIYKVVVSQEAEAQK
ncbi:MAG: ABC transporter ATP-binding protein [Planctomycetes bacterium]|nr:ABC transporter ATP-binding protein [Planctomycetota bacterium]